jgi:hypothetical protein
MNPQNFASQQKPPINGLMQGQHPINYGIPARIIFIYSANPHYPYFNKSAHQFLDHYIRNADMSMNPVWRGYPSAYPVSYSLI